MKNLRLMGGEPDCRVHLLVFPSMRLSSKLPESWRQILSRSLELDVLAALFVFATASFIFLKLVSEMREGETRSADQAILLALRDPNDLSNPIGPQWVETMCRDLTSLGSPTVLALFTIAAVSYLWIDGKRAAALFVALSVTGGVVLVTVLKFGFARPRPELVSHLINVNSFSSPAATQQWPQLRILRLASSWRECRDGDA
jgi:undecaprenyl-diphosphatase